MNELGVRCNNIEKGCKWTGTVGTVPEHLKKRCEFTLLSCPNKCMSKRKQKFMRKDLGKHLKKCPKRSYFCPHCGKKGKYDRITLLHDGICKKKVLPCSNEGCTERNQRQYHAMHLKRCPFTTIPCKYESLGCNFVCIRKDMAAHEQNDECHKCISLDKLLKLTEKTNLAEPFRVTKGVDNEFHFYSHPQGYYMRLSIRFIYGNFFDREEYDISVDVNVVEGRYDENLEWPFVGSVHVTLLNQKEDKRHYTRTLKLSDEDGIQAKKSFSTFISYAELGTFTSNINDNLYFKVSVDTPEYQPWLFGH